MEGNSINTSLRGAMAPKQSRGRRRDGWPLVCFPLRKLVVAMTKGVYALFILFALSTPSFAKPLVVATFSILGDMVHEIGQDKIEVKTLVGSNQDSHVYEPNPQNARDLKQADMVFVNGLGFEGWLDRLIEASGFQGEIVVATVGIDPLKGEVHGKEVLDPHAWHSLKNAQVYITNIVKGLSELMPDQAPFFKARGKAYKKELAALEKEMQQQLKDIPLENRKVITGHDAFAYLGRDFGITFLSPVGMSTESEASAKAVAGLIRQIKEEKIQAIFIENISNPRLIQQIANETGIQIGGVLYSDALSAPGGEAGSYLKMMTFNLSSLAKAMRSKK